MDAVKIGIIKWLRDDGSGYLIDPNKPDRPILIYLSAVHYQVSNDGTPILPDRGETVKFKSREILGREVATDVWPI